MREIKFRLFYKPENKMKNLYEILPQNKIVTWFEDGEQDWCYYSTDGSNGDAVIMQYTGVKDDAGNEIYEGDIVRVSCALIAPQSIDLEGEVKMLEGGWVIDSGSTLRNLWSEVHNVQIIGNIYEGLRK